MEGEGPAGSDQEQGEAGGPHGAACKEPTMTQLERISNKTISVLTIS